MEKFELDNFNFSEAEDGANNNGLLSEEALTDDFELNEDLENLPI